MMATLTAAAAAASTATRHVLCSRTALLVRHRPGAAAAIAVDDGTNDETDARIPLCPMLRSQSSPFTWSIATNRHRDSIIIHRPLSSGTKEPSAPSTEGAGKASSDDGGFDNDGILVLDLNNPASETSSKSIEPPLSLDGRVSGRNGGSGGSRSLDPNLASGRHSRRRRKRDQPRPVAGGALLSPLTQEEYNPETILSRIRQMSLFNQGRKRVQAHSNLRYKKKSDLHHKKYQARKWDYESVRLAADDYERHLLYVRHHLRKKEEEGRSKSDKEPNPQASLFLSACPNDPLDDIHPDPDKCAATHRILSPQSLAHAVRALTRSKTDTPFLSRRIRDIERLVGSMGRTPITEELSYRLLEANAKAGNVRRMLALLELRRLRGYAPREHEWVIKRWRRDDIGEKDDNEGERGNDGAIEKEDTVHGGDCRDNGGRDPYGNPKANYSSKINPSEFLPGEIEFAHAITSIQSAQLTLRRSRNIYLHESSYAESSLDNPTRYLDAILLNMSRRGVLLRPALANRMLACYASSGRTGRALHYFYRVARDPIKGVGHDTPGSHSMNKAKENRAEWKREKRRTQAGRFVVSGAKKEEGEVGHSWVWKERMDNCTMTETADVLNEQIKVRMIMHPPPPFHKIPSEVRDTSFSFEGSLISTSLSAQRMKLSSPGGKRRINKTRYEWELEREWSPTLTAAFAFANSLTHGACGHDPIELDVVGWNCLIKACTHRGALSRALRILNETMPQRGIEPNIYSYNTVMAALARVGDMNTLRELLTVMTNNPRLKVDKYTVQAMADGYLNVGDVPGAATVVQDVFNQHDALPPYKTHIKIIEFALASSLVFEAKRHVYFIQQLWKWEPSRHHDKGFIKIVEHTKRNPKLSKHGLQKLFRYFREELKDEDFF